MAIAHQSLPFHFVDVFAVQPLTGNPLAVVEGGDKLPLDILRRIAREFNQSETTPYGERHAISPGNWRARPPCNHSAYGWAAFQCCYGPRGASIRSAIRECRRGCWRPGSDCRRRSSGPCTVPGGVHGGAPSAGANT